MPIGNKFILGSVRIDPPPVNIDEYELSGRLVVSKLTNSFNGIKGRVKVSPVSTSAFINGSVKILAFDDSDTFNKNNKISENEIRESLLVYILSSISREIFAEHTDNIDIHIESDLKEKLELLKLNVLPDYGKRGQIFYVNKDNTSDLIPDYQYKFVDVVDTEEDFKDSKLDLSTERKIYDIKNKTIYTYNSVEESWNAIVSSIDKELGIHRFLYNKRTQKIFIINPDETYIRIKLSSDAIDEIKDKILYAYNNLSDLDDVDEALSNLNLIDEVVTHYHDNRYFTKTQMIDNSSLNINPNNIKEDPTHRFVSDVDKTKWNGSVTKADIDFEISKLYTKLENEITISKDKGISKIKDYIDNGDFLNYPPRIGYGDKRLTVFKDYSFGVLDNDCFAPYAITNSLGDLDLFFESKENGLSTEEEIYVFKATMSMDGSYKMKFNNKPIVDSDGHTYRRIYSVSNTKIVGITSEGLVKILKLNTFEVIVDISSKWSYVYANYNGRPFAVYLSPNTNRKYVDILYYGSMHSTDRLGMVRFNLNSDIPDMESRILTFSNFIFDGNYNEANLHIVGDLNFTYTVSDFTNSVNGFISGTMKYIDINNVTTYRNIVYPFSLTAYEANTGEPVLTVEHSDTNFFDNTAPNCIFKTINTDDIIDLNSGFNLLYDTTSNCFYSCFKGDINNLEYLKVVSYTKSLKEAIFSKYIQIPDSGYFGKNINTVPFMLDNMYSIYLYFKGSSSGFIGAKTRVDLGPELLDMSYQAATPINVYKEYDSDVLNIMYQNPNRITLRMELGYDGIHYATGSLFYGFYMWEPNRPIFYALNAYSTYDGEIYTSEDYNYIYLNYYFKEDEYLWMYFDQQKYETIFFRYDQWANGIIRYKASNYGYTEELTIYDERLAWYIQEATNLGGTVNVKSGSNLFIDKNGINYMLFQIYSDDVLVGTCPICLMDYSGWIETFPLVDLGNFNSKKSAYIGYNKLLGYYITSIDMNGNALLEYTNNPDDLSEPAAQYAIEGNRSFFYEKIQEPRQFYGSGVLYERPTFESLLSNKLRFDTTLGVNTFKTEELTIEETYIFLGGYLNLFPKTKLTKNIINTNSWNFIYIIKDKNNRHKLELVVRDRPIGIEGESSFNCLYVGKVLRDNEILSDIEQNDLIII